LLTSGLLSDGARRYAAGMASAPLAGLLQHWRDAGAGPAYDRLAAALRALVLDGRLALGARLPSERGLAEALGVSRTTVTAAYSRLETAGLARRVHGAGTFVALPSSAPDGAGAPLQPGGQAPGVVELTHASPAATPWLAAAWEEALVQLAAHRATPGYAPAGLPALRARIAERFTARGLPTSPDQVMVTNGAQHAFALLLDVLTDPGDRVLVEHPTYPNAVDALRRRSLRPVPVPMASTGWDEDAVAAALRQSAPRLAYLMPDHQNPTGHHMADDVRQRLADMLARQRTTVVVDETLAELGLDDAPPAVPFAALARRGAVVVVGSASKTCWGGLRVGWVRAEPSVLRQLAVRRAALDGGTATGEQLVVAALLDRAEVLLEHRRTELRTARDALLAALALHVPHWAVRPPGGGLVVWCDLGRHASTALVTAAEQAGLRLVPGPRFGVDGSFEQYLRIPYCLPPDVLVGTVPVLARIDRAITDPAAARLAEHDPSVLVFS
jgi:DNA-binding transcriptional MocR family regulator